MLREWDLNEVTDGKKYTSRDMATVSCNDCAGCSYCCHEVEDTIVLDPYDMYMLETGAKIKTEELFGRYLELRMVDGIILPNLKIDAAGGCLFLNAEGRCSIHEYRTGFCRLYPLARIYEEGTFYYAYLKNQCRSKGPLSKIKISKWLGISNIKHYEEFVTRWHYFLKKYQERFLENPNDATQKETVNKILGTFYLTPYGSGDFYGQFEDRMGLFK